MKPSTKPRRTGRPARDPVERFYAYVRAPRVEGRPWDRTCWRWKGWTDNDGVGRFRDVDGRLVLAHRAGYELFVGPIPPGHDLVATCRHPWCCNPRHREPKRVYRMAKVCAPISPEEDARFRAIARSLKQTMER